MTTEELLNELRKCNERKIGGRHNRIVLYDDGSGFVKDDDSRVGTYFSNVHDCVSLLKAKPFRQEVAA